MKRAPLLLLCAIGSIAILWWGFRLRPALYQDSVGPVDENVVTIQPGVERTGSIQSELERDDLIGRDLLIVRDDDADTRTAPERDRLAEDRAPVFDLDSAVLLEEGIAADQQASAAIPGTERPAASAAMEGQVWDFLSSHSDLKITSIPMVKCRAKDCEIYLTGASPGEIASLVRDMSGNERWSFNSAAIGVNQEVSPGLVVTVIRLSSDPKAFSETRSVAATGKI